MSDYSQDPTAKLDYTQNWAPQLAANGGATIASHTVSATGGATILQSSRTTTTVTYRLVTSGVTTVPSEINATVHVVLSTGEEDEHTDTIQVTNT